MVTLDNLFLILMYIQPTVSYSWITAAANKVCYILYHLGNVANKAAGADLVVVTPSLVRVVMLVSSAFILVMECYGVISSTVARR